MASMSINPLLEAMTELKVAHEDLLNIANKKTKVLIDGEMETLQKLLVDERKAIKVLEKAERKRQHGAALYQQAHHLTDEEMNVSALLETLSDEAVQSKLEELAVALIELVTALKRVEDTNKSLLEQSMQFVQFSIDLMSPSLNKLNYGKEKQPQREARSTFDSKA